MRSVHRNCGRRKRTLFDHRNSPPTNGAAENARSAEQSAPQTSRDSAAEGSREGAAAEAAGVPSAPLRQRDHRHPKRSHGCELRSSKSSRCSRTSRRHAPRWRSDSRRWIVFATKHRQQQSNSVNRFSLKRRGGRSSKRAWRIKRHLLPS